MRVRDFIGNVVVVTSSLCIIGAVLAFARARVETHDNADPSLDPPRHITNSEQYARRGFAWGPAAAVHTVVVFSDFECPYCRRFAAVIDSFRALHPEVRVVERHWPLETIHPQAFKAALAAECAREVGS